jgi:hypothetical protein
LTLTLEPEARLPRHRSTSDLRVLVCPDRESAWRQYWRHAANAAVFAILTHAHVELMPSLHQQASVQPGTRPPNPDPAPRQVDPYAYEVRVPRVVLQLPGSRPQRVDGQHLILSTWPGDLSEGQRLILRFLMDTPRAQNERDLLLHLDYLFRYDAARQQYRRRENASGDLPWLIEGLLGPHNPDLLAALMLGT